MVKTIVILGPESTGKSTLCKQLAHHFGTIWCPEYAREYLLQRNSKYTYQDLEYIAKGQFDLEKKYKEQASKYAKQITSKNAYYPLFLDTDKYVLKVWCNYAFGECYAFIEEEITTKTQDMYLLCQPDLPWIKDELREYPQLETRKELFHIYKNILQAQSVPWHIIVGTQNARLKNAIEIVTPFLTANI